MNMHNLIDHNIIVIEKSRLIVATHHINYFLSLHQCVPNGPSCSTSEAHKNSLNHFAFVALEKRITYQFFF
jgi:hypothetical protein